MTNTTANSERGGLRSRDKATFAADTRRLHDGGRARNCDARLAQQVAAALPHSCRVSVRRIGRLCGVFDGGASADAPVGFVFGDDVYLKAGPEGITRYLACGMRPFRPGPRQPLRGYWRVPAEVLADPAALRVWAAAAVDAVRRFGKRQRPLKRRRRPATREANRTPGGPECG